MKKIMRYIPIIFLSLLFSSCLKSGLKDLPAFSDAAISNFRFEYRWTDASTFDQMHVIQLKTVATIDATTNTVSCTATVPAVSAAFPQANRDQVTLSDIVGYADISTAATMNPVGNAPELGTMADFSKGDMQYEVTAADGTKKAWTLKITAFNK